MFIQLQKLMLLGLNFNNITEISFETFAGLKGLRTLMMIKNQLKFIPNNTFADTSVRSLFLHSNAIESIDHRAFYGLNDLEILTLFDNPFTMLPDGIFNDLTAKTEVSITCKWIRQLPRGNYTSVIDCAPSTSFHILLNVDEVYNRDGFIRTGFECRQGVYSDSIIAPKHYNCSLCTAGFYNEDGSCMACPAGGFYQDQMGQVECKRCSVGTFVSVERVPGKSATDCWACPYGTLSNQTADYRACRCLHSFYRMDRFGPCTACPSQGINCANDTAILAPSYYWNWTNPSDKESYKNFVNNIYYFGADYDERFSKFPLPLPKPVKCPYVGSCKGGIDSECHEGYEGNLCATCTNGYYLRFNTCLKCPGLTVSILSSLLVIAIFVVVFLMVLWGDSKTTVNNRTVADVVMSCFKIVIGFYQVIGGIFSALARVQWPVTLISMEKCLKLFEGNVFQFAPLSCIYPNLRLDQFSKFISVISVNLLVVVLILLYLFLKKRHIKRKLEYSRSEQKRAVSSLKKSCYRNIFLFLLVSYPMTSKIIIQILPLPGACVTHCFADDKIHCISLLRADYSIECFTARHKLYWLITAVFALYPLGFPLLMLLLVYKYRESKPDEEIAFGLKVFFENYKSTFWFWEITEMYRKLILISLICIFDSESLSQIGLTVFTVSAFGVAYTFFRPIKGKFEDRLQTFVLWVIFFDVCLGAMYTTCDAAHRQKGNESVLVNVLFVVLNSSVLLVALGKGISYMKFVWKKVSSCLMQCFHISRSGVVFLKRRFYIRFQSLILPNQHEAEPLLIH